jgi:hypothetical protein
MEARRREIYETLYPLARYGARRNIARVERDGLNQDDVGGEDLAETVSARYESNPLNDDDDADVDMPPPYTRYAAEREGVTDRTMRNRLRIAEKLHLEVESDDVDRKEIVSLRYESGVLNSGESVEVETAPTYIQYAAEREGVTDRTSAGVVIPSPSPRATLARITEVLFQGRTGHPVLRETKLSRIRSTPSSGAKMKACREGRTWTGQGNPGRSGPGSSG